MSCGCCLDACPQYAKLEVPRAAGESDAEFNAREQRDYDVHFVGAHAISQAIYYNLHPTGKLNAGERLDALMEPGGIQVCGNAQNCVAVCPKEIPLTTSIGRAGRAATKRHADQVVRQVGRRLNPIGAAIQRLIAANSRPCYHGHHGPDRLLHSQPQR